MLRIVSLRYLGPSLIAALILGTVGCAGPAASGRGVSASGKPGVLFLARHGQTEWNRVSRFQGDPDLDQIGYLNRVSLWLLLKNEKLGAIYTSSKQRTQRTAQLVARQHKLPIRVRPALDEIHSGVLEGICYKHMQPDANKAGVADCDVLARGSRPALAIKAVQRIWAEARKKGPAGRVPLGENYDDMIKRLKPLIPELKASLARGNVLAVGHGLINRVALHLLLGWSIDAVHKLRQENDQVYKISGLAGVGPVQISLYTPGTGWKRCTPPKAHQRHLDCSPPPAKAGKASAAALPGATPAPAKPSGEASKQVP